MPPKAKGSAKAPPPKPKAPEPAPATVDERCRQRFRQTNALEQRVLETDLSGLTPAEKKTFAHARLLLPVAEGKVSLGKAERDFWKHVTKESLPIRRLRDDYRWGADRSGRDFASYTLADFQLHTLKQAKLTALDILHRRFLAQRDDAQRSGADLDILGEKQRRREMAALKRELYGQIMGSLAEDPEWDDVIPIPPNEPEDALAKIAYPDDYAEAVSYLRAVMAAGEYSTRCLRLTDLVISMNPAHYTVWLYRFKIVSTLDLSVTDEVSWLNDVAMANLKNYQIWHHRQLLLDHYLPTILADDEAVRQLAASESQFLASILAEDTKNYHVWSYRQYLVETLGLWTPTELDETERMIDDDVRNNSAWSHRFFVVFCNPAIGTPGLPPAAHDVKVPAAVIDREVAFAQDRIITAPQNQSGWNYLRGVLAKGGRELASVCGFAEQFVSGLGEESEEVWSSHALDLLADVYHEAEDKEKAALCLRRLGEKWDPVREGYWKFKAAELGLDA